MFFRCEGGLPMKMIISLAIAFVFIYNVPVNSCTVFSLPRSSIHTMAKSLDWPLGHGMVVVNKRFKKKQALVGDPQALPLVWVSKYGSVSFNQVGLEFPYGGINERGLSVEVLNLDETKYPQGPLEMPGINELQWIQYILDSAATFLEAVDFAQDIRVVPFQAKVHYFVCDSLGVCGSFEYLGGKLVISPAQIPTLANNSYFGSIEFLKLHQGFGGDKPIPQDPSSLSRFVRATALASTFEQGIDPISFSFEILSRVRNGGISQWNIVYNNTQGQVHFRTKANTLIKSLRLSSLDYQCPTPLKVLNLSSELSGDVGGAFVDLTVQINNMIVDQNSFLNKELIAMIKAYPLKFTGCVYSKGK